MKRQLFVAQLPVLLEQRTAQNRLGRQSLASGLPWPAAAQIAGHQAQQRALSIQPQRHRLQLAADLVPRKNLEYRGLDDAFRTHGRLRWCGLGFGFNGLHPQHTGSKPRSEEPTSELQYHRDLHSALHDALPIYIVAWMMRSGRMVGSGGAGWALDSMACIRSIPEASQDRKSPRLNSSTTEIYTLPYTTLFRSISWPG